MKYIQFLLGLTLLIFLSGCDDGPKSALGFTLPDGNADYGEQYFVEFRCIDCHTVKGKEDTLVGPDGIDPIMNVVLGGRVMRIATYGQLVTSVINPSHRVSNKYRMTPMAEDGQSMMRNYNTIMTVDELIDIVAFLQAQYELEPYRAYKYKVY